MNKKTISTLLLFLATILYTNLCHAIDTVQIHRELHSIPQSNHDSNLEISAMNMRELNNNRHKIDLLLKNNNHQSAIKLNDNYFVEFNNSGNNPYILNPVKSEYFGECTNKIISDRCRVSTTIKTDENIKDTSYRVSASYKISNDIDWETSPFQKTLTNGIESKECIKSGLLSSKTYDLELKNTSEDLLTIKMVELKSNHIVFKDRLLGVSLSPDEALKFKFKINEKLEKGVYYEYIFITYLNGSNNKFETIVIPVTITKKNYTLMVVGSVTIIVMAGGIVHLYYKRNGGGHQNDGFNNGGANDNFDEGGGDDDRHDDESDDSGDDGSGEYRPDDDDLCPYERRKKYPRNSRNPNPKYVFDEYEGNVTYNTIINDNNRIDEIALLGDLATKYNSVPPHLSLIPTTMKTLIRYIPTN